MRFLPQRLVSPVRLEMEVISSLGEASLSWGGSVLPSLLAGKDGVTNPKQTCRYCKDMGHLLENCLSLEARNKFIAEQEKMKEGLN